MEHRARMFHYRNQIEAKAKAQYEVSKPGKKLVKISLKDDMTRVWHQIIG